MLPRNDYNTEMDNLYRKSLVLESPSDMDPVLYFYWVDTIAHLDYTLAALIYSPDSVRCLMSGEYLRHRVDVSRSGEFALFPKFMVWLRDNNQEAFESTPILWQLEYDPDEEAGYLGFRIVLDRSAKTPLPPQFFRDMTDDLFKQEFLRSIYPEGKLGKLFAEFKAGNP